jgi:hypothetical protein
LNIWSSTGAHIIKMGENKAGMGSVIAGAEISDTGEQTGNTAAMGVTEEGPMLALREGGNTRAAISVYEGLSHVNVMSADGIAVGGLSSGPTGGVLALTDNAGGTIVQAGAAAPGVGVVEAYPVTGVGSGLIPIPGTYIKGHKRE